MIRLNDWGFIVELQESLSDDRTAQIYTFSRIIEETISLSAIRKGLLTFS